MNFLKQDLKSQVANEVPYLRRFARGLTNDPVYADDLVQDTIERAITRLHLFEQNRKLRTWLYTILRNLYINELRKQGRRGTHMSIDDVLESSLSEGPSQSDKIIEIDIKQAIMALPDEQREVLVLVALEEVTYEEAAKIVDVPVGTIMSRLSRARSKLKEILGHESKSKGR